MCLDSTKVTESQRSRMLRDRSEKGYHKLIVWKKARELVSEIYKITEQFPKSEEFGLKGQLRRASVSVVLNIVEGYRRRSTKEFIRFIDIAQASLTEIEAGLEIALGLKYLTETQYAILENKRSEVAFLLNSLVKSLRKNLK